MIELRIGRKRTGFRVVEDDRYPGMYRVRYPDGRLSDMVNLSRAKDAVLGMAHLGGGEVGHWDSRQTRAEASAIRQNTNQHSEVTL